MYDLRQAAIEYFQHIIDATNTDGSYNLGFIDGLEFCINHLSTMPSAQPEQKKGRWLSHYEYLKRKGYNPSGLIALWWCDQCERGGEHATNFCPNCGAKMEGEE